MENLNMQSNIITHASVEVKDSKSSFCSVVHMLP